MADVVRRAYAVLHCKAVDDDQRIIRGIASTPDPDRMGDIIEPLGITFKNPVPLLLYHDTKRPVGTVAFDAPTVDGLTFTASLPRVAAAGTVRDRIEEAWESIKAGLLAGVSIGFRSIEDAWHKETGGIRFLKSEVLELSLVAIPANAGATIASIKALDLATYPPAPPVVRSLPPQRKAMTTAERITQFENTRAAKAARLNTIMTDAGDATLDDAQVKEYDGLEQEVHSIDSHLVRLRALEQSNQAAAIPVPPQPTALVTKTQHPIIQVKANVPPATAFIRYCQAKAFGRGDSMKELAFAQQWEDSTPEVITVLKAAVAAGTTSDAVWAGPLAPIKPLSDAFLSLLRPATILGKIPGLRNVPFNVSVPVQTGGGTYTWVGQGAPKPVGSLAFSTITLGITKCAGIIVITEELARNSSPAAEDVIRQDMINGIAAFLDVEFTDPTKAAVAGVSPGSITNGVTAITSAGTTPANARTDIQALINAMTAAGISTVGAVLIMSETNAAALGASLNALGQDLFPGLGSTGGRAMGIQVIASQSAANNVILIQPSTVLFADDGGVSIDISREASIQMDGAPAAVPDATTVYTSFWQMNYVGLRAERFVNWKRGRTAGVQRTSQAYVAA